MDLRTVIADTLSPYADTRTAAEARLSEGQKSQGYPLELLKLVASAECEDVIRQAAAVNFKNAIKKGWDTNREDGNDGIVISTEDRNMIKNHLVQLMCTVPPQIQSQLSESISLIAEVDYPDHWQNLLPELVQQFNSNDPTILIGVLTTANSIFKGFRYVQRSDDLYRRILFSLNGIQEPLLTLFSSLGSAITDQASIANQLKPLFQALRLICRIVFSLNYQDLPEYFEDHMADWMTGYGFFLEYNNPQLEDTDEETEPDVTDNLKVAIITILSLYANKDEESFMAYLPNFTKMIWNLLMNVSPYPKHDMLATTSIKFLSALLEKAMHKHLFQDDATLREIIHRIVIPNLTFRESDQEKFEDDPKEYMMTEIEGSDNESRRKCSQDLLKAMCRNFENQATEICSEQIGTMLAEYASNPNSYWVSKDTAIHLMMGVAIRRESTQGVSEINQSVNIMDFFTNHILPELQDTSHTSRPVLKATSIKFINIFRNQFETQYLVHLMPLLIAHLSSDVVVVHTFAAYAIERILVSKDYSTGKLKFGRADLQPFLQPLFAGLFAIVDDQNNSENDYVMKCVMRALASAREDVRPVTEIVITKLTDALGRVAKNPQNPQFNHYLFESIGVLVRSVCLHEPQATSIFEPLLFVPFNIVLQQDIAEFTPYVFQILAQLLEYRIPGTGLGDAYSQLFPPLLTPQLWEKKGNVPALARLFQAYISKAASELVPRLTPIFGVFQKLLASKATETSAFEILNSVIIHFPASATEPALPTVFQLLLVRLQTSRTPRYIRLVTTFFALFVAKFGDRAYFDRMNAVQAGLGTMLILQVWGPRMTNDPPVQRMEAKIQVVGITRLLCESEVLLTDPNAWGQLLIGVTTLLSSGTLRAVVTDTDDIEFEVAYDAQYSRLIYASKEVEDALPDIADPTMFFVQSLHARTSANPVNMQTLIQQSFAGNSELAAGLESLFAQAGLRLA